MFIKNAKTQMGFSLIETIIVCSLILLIAGVFGSFLMKVKKASAENGERALRNQNVGDISQITSADLETIGANMTMNARQSFTGTIKVPFLTNADYKAVDGNVTGIGQGSFLYSQVLFKGKSELSFSTAAPNFTIYLGTVGDSATGYSVQANNGTASLSSNGKIYANTAVQGETAFKIAVIPVILNNQAVCQLKMTVAAQEYVMDTVPCQNSQEIKVSLPANYKINSMSLVAGEMSFRNLSYPVNVPLLPVYQNIRLTLPFYAKSDGSGFVFLSGLNKNDAFYTTADATVDENSVNLISTNDNSSVTSGEAFLLIDFTGNHSALVTLTRIGSNLTAVPVINQTGFYGFYSLTGDYKNWLFQKGSRLVRLTVVEYRYNSDEMAFYRRLNGDSWENIAQHVQSFSVEQSATAASISYGLKFDIANEGQESDQNSQPVRLSVDPRSLNNTADMQ